MTADILESIIEKRKKELSRTGPEMGASIPKERRRPITPFLPDKGVLLEIKKASPSKGDIALDLNVPGTAEAYAKAGAAAISVLTEKNYFKGCLEDLIAACDAADSFSAATGQKTPAVLRKDFLICPEEIDVSYRAGADAVLLIARILDDSLAVRMIERCRELGIAVLLELRQDDDLRKLKVISDAIGLDNIVCGVNSRDLKDFSIDLLAPAGMLDKIREIAGQEMKVLFESGIRSPKAAAFVGEMGFSGLLLGEAAARNPEQASEFVRAFMEGKPRANSEKWLSLAKRIHSGKLPLVKVCGLTSLHDAALAAELGADFLGFIFSKTSPRNVDPKIIPTVNTVLNELYHANKPKLVGIITECNSLEAQTVMKLVAQGQLDFIQLHGSQATDLFFQLWSLPRLSVVNIDAPDDILSVETLLDQGEPRILIDAKKAGLIGGTGKTIDTDLCKMVKKKTKLWLAGGINPDNIYGIMEQLEPELIDVNSGIEKAPGIKDPEKVRAFFEQIRKWRER